MARSREEVLGPPSSSDPSAGRLFRSPSKLAHGNTAIEFPSGLGIEFQRTLRVPDNPLDDKSYPLPPGFGPFPLLRMADVNAAASSGARRPLPDAIRRRGGVVMPMYQKEAMWVNFKSNGDFNKSYAVKIGAGMVNAISGAKFERGTLGGADEVQEYCHVPKQPWIDVSFLCAGTWSIRDATLQSLPP